MKWFVTSDQHHGHFNIIEYTGRPFKTLEKMDAELIRRFNERVKPEDHAIFLGDFCFRNTPNGKTGEGVPNRAEHYLAQYACKNITMIRGNHDRNNGTHAIIVNAVIAFGGLRIGLCHDPSEFVESTEYNHIDFWCCGHVHTAFLYDWRGPKRDKLIINVGVDKTHFYPIALDEVLRIKDQAVRNKNQGKYAA